MITQISQHWFRLWLGAVRQQAITWANDHPDLRWVNLQGSCCDFIQMIGCQHSSSGDGHQSDMPHYQPLQMLDIWTSRGHNDTKMSSYMHMDFHYKAKTVIDHLIPVPGKTVFILKHEPCPQWITSDIKTLWYYQGGSSNNFLRLCFSWTCWINQLHLTQLGSCCFA